MANMGIQSGFGSSRCQFCFYYSPNYKSKSPQGECFANPPSINSVEGRNRPIVGEDDTCHLFWDREARRMLEERK